MRGKQGVEPAEDVHHVGQGSALLSTAADQQGVSSNSYETRNLKDLMMMMMVMMMMSLFACQILISLWNERGRVRLTR